MLVAPQVILDELVHQNRTAVKWIYDDARDFGADANRVCIGGHSSGAHVVGFIAVTDWDADWDMPADVIKEAISMSDMFDMEPIRLSLRNT